MAEAFVPRIRSTWTSAGVEFIHRGKLLGGKNEAHLKDGDLLQHREVHVQRQLGLELVREQTECGVDVTAALYPAA